METRPIFDGLYAVTDRGQIVRQSTGRVLTQFLGQYGYVKVNLYLKSGRVQRNVHSLVALAFIGPRPSGAHVDHKNTNKRDNYPSNLEYVTPGENTRRAVRAGNFPLGAKHYNARLSAADVADIRRRYASEESGELAREFKICRQTVWKIATRRIWKSA